MLSPGGEFDQPSVWLDLCRESMQMYREFVEKLREKTAISIDFKICGCRKFSEDGRESHLYPGDGFVDPTDLLRALHTECDALGVELLEHQPVATIQSEDHAAVVIAAGAWSNQVSVTHGDRRVDLPPVKPIKGHLIGFDLEPGTLGPMLRRGHTYILQRSSGFTIAGSTEEEVGFDRSVDAGICAEIHRRATELWPALANRKPSRQWIGFRPCPGAPGAGPYMTRVNGTNVWLAYGHYRNGILLAPLTAQRITAEIESAE